MDVLVASPEERYCATSAPMQVEMRCAKLTLGANETLCKIDTIAPHIHVLPRDIPFILNIKKTLPWQGFSNYFQSQLGFSGFCRHHADKSAFG